MMKVEVLSGPPGCGKSHLMREEAIANPGRYIFFYPTAKLIAEQEAEFRKIPGLDVQIAYAKSRRSGSVQDQLNADAERARIAGIIHTIELMTHETVRMAFDLVAGPPQRRPGERHNRRCILQNEYRCPRCRRSGHVQRASGPGCADRPALDCDPLFHPGPLWDEQPLGAD